MVQKLPMTSEDLDRLEVIAMTYPKDSDHYRVFMILRYTGMHVCCLYRKESRIKEIQRNGHTHIKWFRPMKGKIKGVKNLWEILPGIIKHNKIDFNVEEYYNQMANRRRKTGNMYFYRIIKEIGDRGGLSDISPNTLRHSLAVYLIEDVRLSYQDVADLLGCSIQTLHKHYAKVGKKAVDDRLVKAGW
ncbi:MAG: hypothetical protein ACTSSE_08610 [Candidatus Thorarchaeota archaeon]